jgi:hypothetical protein
VKKERNHQGLFNINTSLCKHYSAFLQEEICPILEMETHSEYWGSKREEGNFGCGHAFNERRKVMMRN